jgi:hypothetical protein
MGFHAPSMITKIRLRVSDMQKTRFSDYDVLSALNDARTMLWIALAETFSTLPRKRVELTLGENGNAHLPPDYYSLVRISPRGCARVDGFYVRGTPGETVELVYNGLPLPSGDLNYVSPSTPLFEVTETADGAMVEYNGGAWWGAEGEDDQTTPFSLALDVVEIAAAILTGDTNAAAGMASVSARRVSHKREWGAIPDRRPFP